LVLPSFSCFSSSIFVLVAHIHHFFYLYPLFLLKIHIQIIKLSNSDDFLIQGLKIPLITIKVEFQFSSHELRCFCSKFFFFFYQISILKLLPTLNSKITLIQKAPFNRCLYYKYYITEKSTYSRSFFCWVHIVTKLKR